MKNFLNNSIKRSWLKKRAPLFRLTQMAFGEAWVLLPQCTFLDFLSSSSTSLPLPLCSMASACSLGGPPPQRPLPAFASVSVCKCFESTLLFVNFHSLLWLDLREILWRFSRLEFTVKARPVSSLLWQLGGHLNKGATSWALGHHPCWLSEKLTVFCHTSTMAWCPAGSTAGTG